jgi:hypothetical protein
MKVTLELIYQAVDERTEEIIIIVNDIKKRQEDDFRYLIQKIDTDIGQLAQLQQIRHKKGGKWAKIRHAKVVTH